MVSVSMPAPKPAGTTAYILQDGNRILTQTHITEQGVATMRFSQHVLPIALFLAIVTNVCAQEPSNTFTSPRTGPPALTLMAALDMTLKHNPALAASTEEVHARDAATIQASLLPNPELAVELENFAGSEDLQGFDGAETTIALSQRIELGSKRSKRRQVASLEKDLAEWDYQSKKLDVLTATAKAFIRVLAAQEQVLQSEELTRLAEQTLAAVSARVDAGKVPPLEQTRAQVELAVARTTAGKAVKDLDASRRRLAAFWGKDQIEFKQVIGDLTTLTALPSEASIRPLLTSNPDLARWGDEVEQREAALTLSRSQSIPDVTFSFGVRNFQETDNNALVAGVGLTLPLFDRNQGGISEARANLEKTRHERRAAETENLAGFAEAWQNLSAAYLEATSLRDDILPGAQSAFEAADFGYREGKFDFLQMLDAQRTLFEAKGQYLQALAAYHEARTEVERLVGTPLTELPQTTTPNSELR